MKSPPEMFCKIAPKWLVSFWFPLTPPNKGALRKRTPPIELHLCSPLAKGESAISRCSGPHGSGGPLWFLNTAVAFCRSDPVYWPSLGGAPSVNMLFSPDLRWLNLASCSSSGKPTSSQGYFRIPPKRTLTKFDVGNGATKKSPHIPAPSVSPLVRLSNLEALYRHQKEEVPIRNPMETHESCGGSGASRASDSV